MAEGRHPARLPRLCEISHCEILGEPLSRPSQALALIILQESHPFTIASLPDDEGRVNLRMKTRSGLTMRLAKQAAASQDREMTVIVDGPWGHLSEDIETFDKVIVCAGGVGATFAALFAEELTSMGRDFQFVWTGRRISKLCRYLTGILQPRSVIELAGRNQD